MEGTIGEVRLWSANFQPKYWAYCDARLLSISSNSALFSILGTTYGGDGRVTFALPDLRGRTIIGTGSGAGLSQYFEGEMGGTPSTTLLQSNLPPHKHTADIKVTLGNATATSEPAGQYVLATAPGSYFDGTATSGKFLAPVNTFVQPAGSSYPVNIQQPYLGLNFIICMYGIYPSRN